MVEQDLPGGTPFLQGLPPLRPVRVVRLGGMLDTVKRQVVADSESPIVWYIGRRQAEILLRRDPVQTRTLLYSAEGGGKTVLMAQWLIVQVLTLLGEGQYGALGATAPTHERLQTLVKTIGQRIPIDSAKERKPGSWATYYTEERELRFVSGHVIQFRSTKKQSAATGSPVQGFTWLASGDDELQDTAENGADPDIEARLRGARTSYRMCTATAKDSPGWRSFRDAKTTTSDWRIERLRFDETPFVWPEHWDRMRRNMSPREWQRRGLALDVGPERMLYTSWDRERNLRPVPRIGAEDVTASVTGAGLAMLVGHDPGKLFDVSILLKLYRLAGVPRPAWWVVDELTTENTTTEQHVALLVKRLREHWNLNQLDRTGKPSPYSNRAIVRADPYSDSGASDNHPSRSVYAVFRAAGLQIVPAATVARAGISKPANLPKEARIEVVNTLLHNAAGESRLFVACDEHRQPVAPRLVECLELSERDEGGKAEAQRKNRQDLSHWGAALGYALWSYERPRGVQPWEAVA